MGLESKSGRGINRETHASIDHTNVLNSSLNIDRVKLPTPLTSDFITPSTLIASSDSIDLKDSCESGWNYSETDTNNVISRTQPATDWPVDGSGSLKISGGGSVVTTDDYGQFTKDLDLTDISNLDITVHSDGNSNNTSIFARVLIDGTQEYERETSNTWEETVTIDVSGYTGVTTIELKHISTTQYDREMGGAWFDDIQGDPHPVDKAFDDDTTTYWQPSPANEVGAWLDLDTGSLSIIGACRIYANSGYAPTIKVEASEDDTNWTEVATGIKLEGGAWKEITFNARYCRYIRATVTDYGTESGIQIADSDYYSRVIDRVSSEHGHGSGVTKHKKGHGERIKPFKSDKREGQKRRIEELEEQVQVLKDITGV